MFLFALPAFKVTHILNHSYGRDFKLIKHLNPLDNIDICKFLGCSDNDSCFNIHFLAECQLNIACARGEIHYEIVKVAPVSVAYELIHQVGSDGASHDSGAVTLRCVLSDETITHSLHSTEFNGSYHCRVVFILEELSTLRTDHCR